MSQRDAASLASRFVRRDPRSVGHPSITEEDAATFDRDGFVIKRAFFDPEEIAMISVALRELERCLERVAFEAAPGDALLRTDLAMSCHARRFMDPASDISIGEFTPAIAP